MMSSMLQASLTLPDQHSQDGAVCHPLLVTDRQPQPVLACLKARCRGNRPVGSIQLQPRRTTEEEPVSKEEPVGKHSKGRAVTAAESPDGVPAVADDATVVDAATPVQQQAAHRQRQLPVWTHDGHRAPV